MFNQHNLTALQYPVTPEQIPAIEKQIGIAINVIGFSDTEGRSRCPLNISKLWQYLEAINSSSGNRQADDFNLPHPNDLKTLDLLYFNGRWALIHNFSRFMGDYNKHEHKRYWCKRCFCSFQTPNSYSLHYNDCKGESSAKMTPTISVKDKKDVL
jgi:hypothetical protein